MNQRRRILLLVLLYIRRRNKRNNILNKQKRRYWVHPILQFKQRQGDWHNLVNEMRLQDEETYFNYMRMTPNMFDYILSKVGPLIQKITTNWRVPIPAAARLSMTIRYI